LKIKLKATLIILFYITMIFTNPILTFIAIDFTDFFMVNIIVYLGYWFFFKSDYLYNSFILIRYKNKRSYYTAFLKTESVRVSAYVTIYVLIALLARVVATFAYPDQAGTFDPISIGKVISFELVTILNLLILRFAEQLISMLHKRITGNIFYIFYVGCSTLISYFVVYSAYSMSLSILSQIYREEIFSIPECIVSYVIMFALLFILLQRLKRSSVRV
jgi:hypothetical protein